MQFDTSNGAFELILFVIWQLLQVLEIQLPGKRVMNAAAFWNGLRGQQLKRFNESYC
jgi:hypothetical protein